ncbi:MAG: hypothetical protein GXP37_02100 [Chloroflexi bacterium]|nr:hypothetical protein [Chloroflexota bacterium]
MKQRQLFVISLIATAGLMVVLQGIDVPLRTSAAPQGIVSFELAGSVATAQAIVQSWDASALAHAGFSLGLDYLFMLAYATTFMLACLWAQAQWRPGWGHRLGALLAAAMPVAALADAIENLALWRSLQVVAAPWPQIGRSMATIKFTLLAVALVYMLVSLIRKILLPASSQR